MNRNIKKLLGQVDRGNERLKEFSELTRNNNIHQSNSSFAKVNSMGVAMNYSNIYDKSMEKFDRHFFQKDRSKMDQMKVYYIIYIYIYLYIYIYI